MSTTATPTFTDKSAWIRGGGFLFIVLGIGCGLLAALGVLGTLIAQSTMPGQMAPLSTTLASLGFYVVIGLLFGWVGIAALSFRRWARAVAVVTGWGWLICGIVSVPVTVAVMPQAMRVPGAPPPDPGVVTFLTVFVLGFMLVFMVALPAGIVILFRGRDAKLTCEQRDPRPSWTDAVPLRVLAVVLLAGTSAAVIAMMGCFMPFQFFGFVFGGLPAALCWLAQVPVLVVAALGLARMKEWAWWLYAGWLVLWTASTAVTFSTGGLVRMYEMWGIPQAQVDVAAQLLRSPVVLGTYAFVLVAMLAYLLHVRSLLRSRAAS